MNAPLSKFWKTSVKIRPHYERISKIPLRGWQAWKMWFLVLTTFFAPVIFWSFTFGKMIEKWPEQKKLEKWKIIFFMPVNHAKEFLKSVHNEVLFWQLFARPLIEVSSTNFKAKILKMAFFNSEFLVVSLVNTAPESPTKLVTLPSTVPHSYS